MNKSHLGLLLISAFLFACNKQDEVTSVSKNASVTPSLPTETIKLASQKTYDGPFGLSMGIPLTELVNVLKFKSSSIENPFIYKGIPPKPASGMNSYTVVATEKQGICKVGASVDVDVVNATGDQIKAEADRIAELLELKYGKYTEKYDFAGQDVYKKNSQFWMMALTEEAVNYGYFWSNSTSLPSSINSISVKSYATSMSSGYTSIIYEFINFNDCQSEFKKQKSTNL